MGTTSKRKPKAKKQAPSRSKASPQSKRKPNAREVASPKRKKAKPWAKSRSSKPTIRERNQSKSGPKAKTSISRSKGASAKPRGKSRNSGATRGRSSKSLPESTNPRKPPKTYAEGRKKHKRPKRKYHSNEWRSSLDSKVKGEHRDFIGRLKVNNARGKRPHISLIRFWLSRRSNVENWIERDGSYWAIATFRGASAFEQLEKAYEQLPLPAYFGIRFFTKKPLYDLGKAGSAPTIIRSKDGEQIALIPDATPTYNAGNPDAWGMAKSFVFKGDPDLYERRYGLAVMWPGKAPKGEKS